MNSHTQRPIKEALASVLQFGISEGCGTLLDVLEYKSERRGSGGTFEEFRELYELPENKQHTKAEKQILPRCQEVHLLRQITDEEIRQEQRDIKDRLDNGKTKSFIFLAVRLRNEEDKPTSRGGFATLTRALNKHFAMPAIVIFREGNRLTLAFIRRREHKTNEAQDVLGKVTLIKDIDCRNPHRAHLDILGELSLTSQLEWMRMNRKGEPPDFEGLLAAWLKKLDISELNKRFYNDLFKWFEVATRKVKFPSLQNIPIADTDNEVHVIRLITRLLFVWFIKEKGLVANELFIEEQAKALLKEWNLEIGKNYYPAILQNLFFATLNTEIKMRRFSRRNKEDHRNQNVYRYEDMLSEKKRFLELTDKTPFINGGLFDSLDSFEATRDDGYRIDCFSDEKRSHLSVPNSLFFGNEGIVTLLDRYKFTVEENTPVEEEVALDPELLGKVFENLLASYNPETRDTARKSTGSYYTPRGIVDYMADESLLAYFMDKIHPAENDREQLRARLLHLLSYESAEDADLPDEGEVDALMEAIANVRVLDPAVGSGAFPMGILQKLTNVLNKIDPENTRWHELQKKRAVDDTERAYDEHEKAERDRRTQEISDTFEHYTGGFGRKLFLIQNSIFGVDIQPIACQIAKLRFFITLAIEQEPNQNPKDNYGIRPLPNLETRFVAANSLIGLGVPTQLVLEYEEVTQLERETSLVRERYFNARTRSEKLRIKDEDKSLRSQMAQRLRNIKDYDLGYENAERVADWDPYNQNTRADWFDPKWMFGISKGFDIVIGNPPYVRQESIKPPKYKDRLLRIYSDATGKSDLYVYFYLRALDLLRDGGTHTFICSNSWLDVGYGAQLQDRLLKSTRTISIFHSEVEREFQTADINTIISVIQKGVPNKDSAVRFVTFKAPIGAAALDPKLRHEIVRTHRQLTADGTREKKYKGDKWGGKYLRAPDIYWTIMEKGAGKFARLGDIADVRFGIKTGANDFFYLDKDAIAQWGIEDEFLHPVVKSPRECVSILVDPARLNNRIFMCHKERRELVGTNALAYIEWGEAQGFQKRPSCRGRARWWDLGDRTACEICANYLVNDMMRSFVVQEGHSVYFSDNFQEVHSASTQMWPVAVALNSMVTQMQINIMGRANFGGGLMKIQTYEVADLLILSPDYLNFDAARQAIISADRLGLSRTTRREALDGLVFDAIQLTAGERDAVYEAVPNMVQKRMDKARGKSVGERER